LADRRIEKPQPGIKPGFRPSQHPPSSVHPCPPARRRTSTAPATAKSIARPRPPINSQLVLLDWALRLTRSHARHSFSALLVYCWLCWRDEVGDYVFRLFCSPEGNTSEHER
jgi:hypothetical protein